MSKMNDQTLTIMTAIEAAEWQSEQQQLFMRLKRSWIDCSCMSQAAVRQPGIQTRRRMTAMMTALMRRRMRMKMIDIAALTAT